MPFGVNEAVGLAGAAANAWTGRSQAKASKEMMRRQAGLLKQQAQTYKQAMPTYQALLVQGSQYAGVDPNHHTLGPNGSGNLGTGRMGSAWGNPEDQLRFAAGQDQINQMAQQRQNMLQHTLAQRGVASSSIGAALAQNQRSSMRDLAGFQRQLQIEAPHEQERRRAALAGLLNPAFGQGAQASAGYGQQGAQYGAQANQAYGATGNIAQNWQQQNALQHYMNLYGTHPGGTAGGGAGTVGGMTGGGYGPGATGYDANQPFALGDGSYVMPDGSVIYP